MLPLKTLLHPTDFSSEAGLALDYALDLARRHQAALHLLHVVPALTTCDRVRPANEAAPDADIGQPRLREREARMQQMLEAHQGEDVPSTCLIGWGPSPAPVILDHVRSARPDLIVLGAHGGGHQPDDLLGRVAQEVVQRAACPVLTIDESSKSTITPATIQRILLPLDLSQPTQAMAYQARTLAALYEYEASLDLLYILEDGSANKTNHVARARQQLEQLCNELELINTTCHARIGQVPDDIVRFSEEQPNDLIIITSRSAQGVNYRSIGSVTEYVVRQATCPVLSWRYTG